jgi:hypothetical protein
VAINYIKPYADKNLYLIPHNVVSVEIVDRKDEENPIPVPRYCAEIWTLNNIVYEIHLNDDAELKAFKVRISHAQSI